MGIGRVLVVLLMLFLTSCGGTGALVSPGSPLPASGDIVLSSGNGRLELTVRFPQVVGSRGTPVVGNPNTSIPFGTDRLLVQAQSTTVGIPYSQLLTLTPANPRGTLLAVPPEAGLALEVVAERLAGGTEPRRLASANATIAPFSRDPVILRLIPDPAAQIPVLRTITPNPVEPSGAITLGGDNLDTVRQVRLTSAGSLPPITISLASSPVGIPIPLPAGVVSGPVIALDAEGIGSGSVNLVVGGIPTPTPTFTPTPLPTPFFYYFLGTVDTVDPNLSSLFTIGQSIYGAYIFDPSTPPRPGSTNSFAVFDALQGLVFTVYDASFTSLYAASSSASQEIQVDNAPGAPNDRYAVLSRASDGLIGSPSAVNGFPLTSFSLRLDDTSNSVFSDALTLPTLVNLSSFDPDKRRFFLTFGSAPDRIVSGSIDEFGTNVIPTPTPLPTPTSTPGSPTISACTPTSGTMGIDVVISGSNLGAVTSVTFNGIPAGDILSSDTQITAEVPLASSPTSLSGPIEVTTLGGSNLCPSDFLVTDFPPAPQVGSPSPPSGVVGDTVTLIGRFFRSFSATPTQVRFTGVGGVDTVSSPDFTVGKTQITAQVPVGAITGPITVTTSFGSTATAGDFVVNVGAALQASP